jgi:hypothetical protein
MGNKVNLEPKRFHVYSKAVPAKRESDIEKHLVKRVKELGGEVRKVQWIGRRGAPDRLVMLPRRDVPGWEDAKGRPGHGGKLVHRGYGYTIPEKTVWVELKAPGEKPKLHQSREHERMRSMGQVVVVIDSIEGVEEMLR